MSINKLQFMFTYINTTTTQLKKTDFNGQIVQNIHYLTLCEHVFHIYLIKIYYSKKITPYKLTDVSLMLLSSTILLRIS